MYYVEAIGDKGLYAIVKIENGDKLYLSEVEDKTKIGRYRHELARSTAYACKIGALTHFDGAWLPWPSNVLPMRTTARFGGSSGHLHRDSLARSPFRALLA